VSSDERPPAERWGAVVVGAGVAGLVAARELALAGVRTLVLDARDAPGGAVRGHEVAGLRLDAGAESFATRGGTVAGYLAELGLADRVCAPSGRGSWVHLPSGDGPLPRTGLLGIPSAPFAADVRRTLGLLGAARASLDLVLPRAVGARATTLGGLVRARMGARVLDRLVRPIVGGVHAAEPDDLAVDAVAPGLTAAVAGSRGSLARAVRSIRAAAPAGAAVAGLEGGVHGLVDALAEQVGEIRLRTPVTRIERTPDGLVVTTPAGPLLAERVLLAAPVPGLLDELVGIGATPDAGAAVTLVTLVLDAPALDAAPRGTGVLVAREATDVAAKALTHATAKWPWLAAAAGPARRAPVLWPSGRGRGRPRRRDRAGRRVGPARHAVDRGGRGRSRDRPLDAGPAPAERRAPRLGRRRTVGPGGPARRGRGRRVGRGQRSRGGHPGRAGGRALVARRVIPRTFLSDNSSDHSFLRTGNPKKCRARA
jgi:oxygen-dependent protoporphyrinogen oxidase